MSTLPDLPPPEGALADSDSILLNFRGNPREGGLAALKAYIGAGPAGPTGPQGATGATGAQGPPGVVGDPGLLSVTPTGGSTALPLADIAGEKLSIFDVLPYAVGQRIKAATSTDAGLHTAINQAIGDIAARGGNRGGVLDLGYGTIPYNGAIVLQSGVSLKGQGYGASRFKQLTGANSDCLVGKDFATLTGGATAGGIHAFSLEDFSIDGRDIDNSSGTLLKLYAYNYTLRGLRLYNSPGQGIISEWGSADGVAGEDAAAHSVWNDLEVSRCNGEAFVMNGPHDSKITQCLFGESRGVHATTPALDGPATALGLIGPSGGAVCFTLCHFHANATYQTAWDLISTGGYVELNNCQVEGGNVGKVWFKDGGNNQIFGGKIFHNNPGQDNTVEGIRFGNTAGATISGANIIETMFNDIGGAWIAYNNVSAWNRIRARGFNNTTTLGEVPKSGTTPPTDLVEIIIDGPAGIRASLTQYPVNFNGGVFGATAYWVGSQNVVDGGGLLVMRPFAKASLPSATVAGRWVYVTDEAGGATPAFSDGTNWRRVADRAVVS